MPTTARSGEKHLVRQPRKLRWLLVAAFLPAAACAESLESLQEFPCGLKDTLCPTGWTCLGYPDGNRCTRDCTTPRDSVCASGRDCKPIPLNDTGVVVCVEPGTTAIGQACTYANDCAEGGLCYKNSDGQQVCVQLCGPGAPCTSGTCAMLTNSMGACTW